MPPADPTAPATTPASNRTPAVASTGPILRHWTHADHPGLALHPATSRSLPFSHAGDRSLRVARVAGSRPGGGGALLRRRLRLGVHGQPDGEVDHAPGGRDRRSQRGEGRPRRHWTPYIACADVDAAAARAAAAGGVVTTGQPADVPGIGRIAPSFDPEKSIFVAFAPQAER